MHSSNPVCLVRKIAPELAELGVIPLFGQAPLLNWKQLSQFLSETLFFSFKIQQMQWMESGEILQGFGDAPVVSPVRLLPLPTPVFWVMSRPDVSSLTSILLTGQDKDSFSSGALEEGYYRYLMLETLYGAKELEPLKQMTLQLGEESLPEESAFCIDLQIEAKGKTFWGRLILPSSMRSEWVRHFAHLPYAPVSLDRAKEVELVLGMRIGSCQLHLQEWGKVKEGDAILLDQSSYDPSKQQGLATLVLGKIPLFHVRIEQNRFTIVDYALYNEETMEGETPPQHISEVSAESNQEEPGSIQNYPISIVVELGRLRVTLDKLMHLSPGNVLDLPIQPDQGVALTVNGRLIGRGEVVSLGETLAVRVLEIGS